MYQCRDESMIHRLYIQQDSFSLDSLPFYPLHTLKESIIIGSDLNSYVVAKTILVVFESNSSINFFCVDYIPVRTYWKRLTNGLYID